MLLCATQHTMAWKGNNSLSIFFQMAMPNLSTKAWHDFIMFSNHYLLCWCDFSALTYLLNYSLVIVPLFLWMVLKLFTVPILFHLQRPCLRCSLQQGIICLSTLQLIVWQWEQSTWRVQPAVKHRKYILSVPYNSINKMDYWIYWLGNFLVCSSTCAQGCVSS